jgi:hypothetical protein
MEAENRPETKRGYDLNPEEIYHLSLTEAEEKMLYLRYVARRENQPLKLIRYQYLTELLEARICLLRQNR